MKYDAPVADSCLALQRLYHFEATASGRLAFVQPMGTAFAGEVRNFTWGEALEHSRRIAEHLRRMDLPPGSNIAILSKSCVYWLLADFAIWMTGHVSVPLYPTLSPPSVRRILDQTEAKLIFVGKLDNLSTVLRGVPSDMPCISFPLASPSANLQWDALVAATPPLQGNPVRSADDLATIVYTSGTTGMAKGAMHTFGTLAWAGQSGIRRVPLDEEGRMLSYLPLAHIAERTMVQHGQLATGAQVYFAESLDTFIADLKRARPTVFFSVPRLWLKFQQNILANIPRRKLKVLLCIPGIRVIVRRRILQGLGLDACCFAIGGAAPMPPALLHWYRDLRLYIADGYGMTENGGLSHSTLPLRQSIGTVGWPFDGVESRIDPQTGEIQIRSGALFKGYHKAPALTLEAFTADGWLRTGDKGAARTDDGALRIIGRTKDLFKTSKGKYVAPAPIESRLLMHDSIDGCAVVGSALPQPIGLVRLVDSALAATSEQEARERISASLDKHLVALNEQLEPHERLDRIVVVRTPWTIESGLLTPTMKIKRHQLENLYAARLHAWSDQRDTVVFESA